eukprot:CAMPEP_0203907364 /NCGR_PEP_ID=MMETSP0359-20131031/48889_1 /ASSEMBLY_ACC=CAM_ASM_000338 /TAXON_ID=268821 /ORGANISM="Scrippsiella Hangoei, Strain SHTV-5" /LENGTH=60 /DNA_ID=CAMNT_0050832169 /DNA_START=64 /DNA_END=243 /DNA_ORIENTATION=+
MTSQTTRSSELFLAMLNFLATARRGGHTVFSVLRASGVLKNHLSCGFMQLTDAKFAARFE